MTDSTIDHGLDRHHSLRQPLELEAGRADGTMELATDGLGTNEILEDRLRNVAVDVTVARSESDNQSRGVTTVDC